ncbi:D-aminoacyl-tRNA deacylase [Desulfocurvus sp. DL9XJH121]
MRLFVQRVSRARVDVAGETVGAVERGLLVLAGFAAEGEAGPGGALWNKMLAKVVDLRIFPDAEDKMNLSLRDCDGGLLVVPQFTLYADCRKGRRPSFNQAEGGDAARALFDRLVADFRELLPGRVEQGAFGERMDVSLVNWGPVTILLDSVDF